MAIARYKTFNDGDILTGADLNGIQDQVINNDQDVGNPRTESFDMDGERLILSEDGNTSLISSTNSKVDFRMASADLVDFDGTVASPVNGITVVASATGSAVQVKVKGSDTNAGLVLAGKGTGTVVLRANSLDVVTVSGVASGVNGVGIVASATGSPVVIGAAGSDTNVGMRLTPKGSGAVDIHGSPLVIDTDGDSSLRETSDDVLAMKLQNVDSFIFDGDAASPVNGLTFRTAATTVDPAMAAHGSDSVINVRLTPKSTGVAACAGGWAVDGATNLTWRWTGSSTSLLLQENTGTATSPTWTTRTTVTTGSTIAGPTLISTATPSAVASISFSFTGGFSRYVAQISLIPATDGVSLYARTNGGSGADSGAADYGWQFVEITTTGTVNGVGDVSDSEIELSTAAVGNAAGEHIDLKIEINPGTGIRRLSWDGGFFDTGTVHRTVFGSGARLGGPALTGMDLLFSSGNIASGTARLWGYP